MDTHFFAYLAGIFDGEGCVGIYSIGVGKTKVLTVAVHMTEKHVVELFHQQFGGSFYFKPRRKEHHKDQWCWVVKRSRALKAMEAMSPWLRIKRLPVEG